MQISFLHPWALWLATGAVVPLLIHLFSRQKPRQVRFPAVRFIRRGRRRSLRRTRLKQLLLLLMRMGLIALVALLIARPVLGRGPAGAGQLGATPAAVLVVDDSLSMNYAVGDESWFDTARNRALEFLRALPSDCAVAALTASRPTGKLVRDTADVAGRIRGLGPTMTAASCWRALEAASALLRGTGAGRKDVFVFTDMTRGAWPGHQQRRLDLGEDTSLLLVDCGREDAVNGAVVDLRDTGGSALEGGNLLLNARVAASGGPVSRTIQFELNGRPVSRREVSLAAGEERTILLEGELNRAGHNWGRVSFLNPDALAPDDARAFTVSAAPKLNVLCVEDEPDAPEPACQFVRLALDPQQEGERAPFRVSTAASAALSGAEGLALADYDLVVLTGAGALDRAAWQRLGTYLSGGGGLLAFCGPATADAYRSEEAVGVLGGRVGEVVTAPAREAFPLRIVGPDHPFVRALRASGAPLEQVRILTCRRLEPSGTAQELMSFGPGLPALVVDEAAGRSAVFASTADDRWGVFARTPGFVPFCREMALHLAAREVGRLGSYAVGAHVPIEFQPSRWPTIVRVRPPGSGASELLMPGTTPGRRTYWKTHRPGYYAVEFERREETWERGFAVNPSAIESYLDRVPPEELRESVNAAAVRLVEEGVYGVEAAGEHRGARDLSPLLVGFALALLLAEGFLANRFYRTPATAEPTTKDTKGATTTTTPRARRNEV
ncbi:MAG: BatA domain-containing protein [Candidatus Brocadiia bacterium]